VTAQPVLDRHLDPHTARTALAADVRAGLTSTPKTLPPKWFYDARGSELFDEITRLPEYYLTRRERSLLQAHAGDIARVSSADTLVELGSGTSEKTAFLLDALSAHGSLRRYVPFDVDESVLRQAKEEVVAAYPGLAVQAVVGDFEHHLPLLPRGDGRRLVAFLGSTIGNLLPQERVRFLTTLAAGFAPGDALLMGTDLVKEPSRLIAAYDDAAGVTAEFNRNVLRVIERELDAEVDVDGFEHVAVWDAEREWIEMRLRAIGPQTLLLPAASPPASTGSSQLPGEPMLAVRFESGEEVRTEISAKFRRERVVDELAAAGLRLAHWWTDPDGDYALSLAVPA
jgi:L-histidine N-alpha-methyltransferase